MPTKSRRLKRPHRFSLLAILMLCGVTSVGLLTLPAADVQGPQPNDRQIALIVSSLMRREHLSKHPLDDEISQRGLESYLKSLDPMKLYFTQEDVDEFMRQRKDLDDLVKKGDLNFAFVVFKRFLHRVDERVALVNELLGQPHDFTVDEEMITDRDLLHYPREEMEVRERWRKRIKYDLLVQKADKKEGAEAVEKLRKRYDSFAKRMHQFDNDEVLEMYLTALTSAYDPHSTYMSKSTLKNFRINFALKLEGIGAALRSLDGNTIVTKVIPGGAADKHGKLKVEDKIVSVGQGTEGEMVDIIDMKLDDVVDKIRGKAGTKVRLGVLSTDSPEVKTYTITRAEIELKDSEARSVTFEAGNKLDGKPYKIGVIDLPSFYMDMEGARLGVPEYKSTTRDMRRLLEDLKEKGVDAVVLDLRRNGGGSLTEAINCSGLFIDRGPVVQVKDQDGRVQVYDDLEGGTSWDGPLVVLTSKFSASASEILAGAIQDYNRGLIIGDEATHGKGTVQSLLDLGQQLFRIDEPPNLGALKITMQQFYRPNGDSTQKRGVLSDIVLPSISNHMDVGEADLDFAVDFDRVPAATFDQLSLVNQEILAKLKAESASRVEKDLEFAKLLKDINRYREQKAKKSVTLNEEKFFAQRAELDADKEDEKQFEEIEDEDDEIVKRDYYFEEALNVTVDYLKELAAKKLAAK